MITITNLSNSLQLQVLEHLLPYLFEEQGLHGCSRSAKNPALHSKKERVSLLNKIIVEMYVEKIEYWNRISTFASYI